MATTGTHVFDELAVDHVEFYVDDIATTTDHLTRGYGLHRYAESPADHDVHSVALGAGRIRLLLTRPRTADHPAAAYLEKHGDGVANIALRVPDAGAAFAEAVRRGARPVSPPIRHGAVHTAAVMGFGDVVHTFVERLPGTDERVLPGLALAPATAPGTGAGPIDLDHFAVCVEGGTLDATVESYRDVFGFRTVFAERITVGEQAIETAAVQSASGAVTLTLIEPDVSMAPGQIDDFLKDHGGPGVQHIALSVRDIVHAVDAFHHAGVRFLSTPDTYYAMLTDRLTVDRHSVEDLRRLGILVDRDHGGQLFQIFAASVHPRGTLFLEVIERLGAVTFGGGNITALYRAVELQRRQDGTAP